MRENARSRGRWSKQQENRRGKLQNLCYEESIHEDDMDRLCQLNALRDRHCDLSHPKAVREMKRYTECVTGLFVTALRLNQG